MRARKSCRGAAIATAIAFVSTLTGCGAPRITYPDATTGAPVLLNDTLTPAERSSFYHLPEGSEIVPLTWLFALRTKTGEPFVKNLARFGFIPDQVSKHNPFGLPVGLGVAVPSDMSLQGTPFVGITCSACHVSEIRREGKAWRIDGGPSNLDVERFSLEVAEATKRALFSTEIAGFFNRVWAYEQELLGPADLPGGAGRAYDSMTKSERVRVLGARARYELMFLRVGDEFGGTKSGFGRADSFGLARKLGFDEGHLPTAPVAYPHLWGFDRSMWLHWTGNTTSVLERNIGQAVALGAVFDRETHDSTVLVRNLNQLERIARKLVAPKWPLELPAIDASKAAAGKAIFERAGGCATCHNEGVEEGGKFRYRAEPLDAIGTDRQAAETFAEPLPNGESFHHALAGQLAEIKSRAYRSISGLEGADWETGRKVEWVAPHSYVARPLTGIWASPPYLHNGSVPTLDALLRPASQRPTVFRTGSREYDVVKVGFVDGGGFTVDTRVIGNSNAGHEGEAFGTNLDAGERAALIEYLKSL